MGHKTEIFYYNSKNDHIPLKMDFEFYGEQTKFSYIVRFDGYQWFLRSKLIMDSPPSTEIDREQMAICEQQYRQAILNNNCPAPTCRWAYNASQIWPKL